MGENDDITQLFSVLVFYGVCSHTRELGISLSPESCSLSFQTVCDWCATVLTSAAGPAFKQSENLLGLLAGIEGDRRMQCAYSVSSIPDGPGMCLSFSCLDCCPVHH